MSLPINHFYRFGEFTLDVDQRVLLREAKPIALTPKVFDTLLILVENNGRIVAKGELMSRLWPDSFVEETNLTFNIKQLRKSLGDDARNPRYIETVARRGYRFIADVEEALNDTGKTGDQFSHRFAKPERSLDARPAAAAASTRVSKRYVTLLATIVIFLAGAGLFWRFSNGSNKSSGEREGVDGKPPAASSLKLERLTGTGQSKHVAISPDGKYIAYTRSLQKRSSIWLRQLATNTNVEIVPPTGAIYGLAFANSGESLYFVKGDPTALCRISLLGGVPSRIVENPQGNFSVSADDSQIAFIREAINRDGQREYSLVIANSDGTGERMLLSGTHPGKLDVPVWSPDGKSIICAFGNSDGGGQNVSLIEVNVAGGLKKELSPDRFSHIAKMAWLPDKTGLIMSARKNEEQNQLWRVSYPSIEISQITEGLSPYLDLSIASSVEKAVASQVTRISDIWVGSSREPRNLKKLTHAIDNFCWTPNGRLVYLSAVSGNGDLWIMEPDGSEQRQLTVDPASEIRPTVTSDNKYIVFLSDRTGVLQVWRMDLDGSNQIQLTDGAGKDHPAISPDGKWVLYNSTDDWHLWKVSIDGGDPIRITDYIAARPTVSPDGKMIACVGRTESKRELLILPFEGGQPLKRLDFSGWGSRLQWAEGGKALIYAAELGGVTSLVKQSLGGGQPERIVDFAEDELFDFGHSIDGQFLAVTRGAWQHDIVLISGLKQY